MPYNGEGAVNYEGLYYFMNFVSKHINGLYYYENEEDFQSTYKHLEEFSEKLEEAVYAFNYDLEDNYDAYYFDMNVEKSDEYVKNFDNFSDFMWDIGLGNSEAYFDRDEGFHAIYEGPNPWEDDLYYELKETGDYWWFLVCMIQKISSPCGEWFTPNMSDVIEILEENYKNSDNGFSFEWFLPLKSFLVSQKIMNEYKNYTIKSIESMSSSVDFSSLAEVDLTNIPEYEIEDSYIENEGKYYDPLDVYRAITAAGGMAQALERQDLEDKITTVNSLTKKKKKNKKIRIKPHE